MDGLSSPSNIRMQKQTWLCKVDRYFPQSHLKNIDATIEYKSKMQRKQIPDNLNLDFDGKNILNNKAIM